MTTEKELKQRELDAREWMGRGYEGSSVQRDIERQRRALKPLPTGTFGKRGQ